MKFYVAKLTNENRLNKDTQIMALIGNSKKEVEEQLKDIYKYCDYDLKIEVTEVTNVGKYEILVKERVDI